MKLIYLEWEDAMSRGSWTTGQKEVEDWIEDGWLVKQIGWIYKETPKYLILVASYQDSGAKEDWAYAHLQKIPKTWVRKRKTVKL